jgi:5-methylcytosine-specific restriction endonuclease McrA
VTDTKLCTNCDLTKPAGDFAKRTLKSGTVTLQTKCKACEKVYREQNREHRLARMRQWWADNKEDQNAKQKEYYQNNREKVRAGIQRWEEENPEKVREISRNTYKRNRDKQLARSRAKYERDKDKLRPIRKAWAKANPEKVKTYEQNRRAREINAEGSFTPDEWLDKLQEFGGNCFYCLELIEGTPHQEHMIPLSRGGTNYIENIVPSCGPCNRKKHDKTAEEFLALGAVS